MTDDLEPLSGDVKGAISDERAATEHVSPALQRRVAGSLAVLAASSATGAAAAGAGISKLVIAGAVAGVLATGAGGAWLVHSRMQPAPAPPPAVQPVAPPLVEPEAEPEPDEEPEAEAPAPAETAAPRPAVRKHRAMTQAERDAQLARENALLESARAALSAQKPDEALAALDRHAHQFKRPVLKEEAEALRIRTLALQGKVDDARTRLEAFESAHPSSPMLPALRRALQK
jgi:hypothetical protein